MGEQELNHDKWAGTTYGNGWMHKWLIRFARVIDLRVFYAFIYIFVVPPTMVVNRAARKAIHRFYRQGFSYSAFKAAWMTYKNHCAFSQVVLDKFAMYAGKRFRISISGYEKFRLLSEQSKGFVQLSSHTGNYEIAGYSLVAKNKRLNALVFGGEKESVMANRNKLFEHNNIRMIPMKEDMSHLFVIDQALADGEILSIAGDRVFGSQKEYSIDFLGRKGKFPQGPFLIAAIRSLPILFVTVMKTGGLSYHITVHRIDCPDSGNTRSRAEAMARNYVALLEGTVRQYPEQWYNFFDIWAD